MYFNITGLFLPPTLTYSRGVSDLGARLGVFSPRRVFSYCSLDVCGIVPPVCARSRLRRHVDTCRLRLTAYRSLDVCGIVPPVTRSLSLQRLVNTSLFRSRHTARSTVYLKQTNKLCRSEEKPCCKAGLLGIFCERLRADSRWRRTARRRGRSSRGLRTR